MKLELEETKLELLADSARSGPKYFIGDGVAYFDDWKVSSGHRSGSGTAWATFVIEPDEEGGEFTVELVSAAPHPDHWLGWLLSSSTLNELLDFDDDSSKQLDWMMALGVVPGQRFLLELRFTVYQDYWGECDEDFGFRLLDVELKSPDQLVHAIEQAIIFVKDGVVL